MAFSTLKKNKKWEAADTKANKEGFRSTVYQVNGDKYRGEWKNNKRHGMGTYRWKETGVLYEGDWEEGYRSGSGVLSVLSSNGQQVKVYSGQWKHDKRHGYGQNWYSENEIYEGEWCMGKRWGWGRMFYADGSIYEGQWANDQRNGDGMMRLPNENRFEGKWINDRKNGKGKYFFLNTGQLMEGVWVDDVPKCCQIVDLGREHAKISTMFEIPEIKLEDPNGVLRETQEVLLANLPQMKQC